MINAGMVFLTDTMAECYQRRCGSNAEISRGTGKGWGQIQYQAKVTQILIENNRAVGVQLASGKSGRIELFLMPRWDTFEKLLPTAAMPNGGSGSNATRSRPF